MKKYVQGKGIIIEGGRKWKQIVFFCVYMCEEKQKTDTNYLDILPQDETLDLIHQSASLFFSKSTLSNTTMPDNRDNQLLISISIHEFCQS